jgi:lysophospholipase L1-like esterase
MILLLPVIPVLLLEGAARLFHDPMPPRRVYDPFAYRIPCPDLVDAFTNWEGESVTVRMNELGMRGPRLDAPAAAGTATLVFLGGSTTENYGFNRPDTFPECVARMLEKRMDRPVRAFNAGASAATTSVNLGRLQHQVIDLKPALVIVMHGINDLIMGFHTGYRADGRHLPLPRDADFTPRSYLLDWLRSLQSPPTVRKPRARDRELHRVDYTDFLARAVFERNLRSMAAIAEAHDIPILFLTQGAMYSEEPRDGEAERCFMADALIEKGMAPPDISSLARGMGAFNATVLGLPRSSLVHTFDLASSLPRNFDIFYDDVHFTKAGNRKVAEVLVPVIEGILRDPRSAEPRKRGP